MYDKVRNSLSRRNLLKGAIGLFSLDTAANWYRQHKRNEAYYQNPIEPYEPIMEKVVAGEPFSVNTVYLHFDEGGNTYEGESIVTGVEKTLESLESVSADVSWEEIQLTPNSSWIQSVEGKGQNSTDGAAIGGFEDAKKSIDSAREQGRLGSLMDYTSRVLETYDSQLADEENLTVVVTDLGNTSYVGMRGGKGMAVVDDNPDDEVVMNDIAHECLHQLGLDHTLFPDVMSYAPSFSALRHEFRYEPGPIARREWRNILAEYEERYDAV